MQPDAYRRCDVGQHSVANLLQVPIQLLMFLWTWRAFIDVSNLIGGGMILYVEKDMYYEDPYAILLLILNMVLRHLAVSGQANMCVSQR